MKPALDCVARRLSCSLRILLSEDKLHIVGDNGLADNSENFVELSDGVSVGSLGRIALFINILTRACW